MKKIALLFLPLLIVLSLFAACSEGEKGEEKVLTLSYTEYELGVYKSFVIEATEKGLVGEISWSSSDSDVVIVEKESDGMSAKVSALSVGEADITVTMDGISKKVHITVTATSEIPALSVNTNKVELITAYTLTLTPSLKYQGDVLKASFSFKSQDTSIAEVSAAGVITAKAKGETKIEVKAIYFGFTQTTLVDVQVKPAIRIVASAAEVKVYLNSTLPTEPSSKSLSAKLFADGEEQTETAFVFTSLNTDIASYSEGVVTAVAEGTTSIKISTTYEDEEYYINIPVIVETVPVITMEMSEENLNIYSTSPSASYVSSGSLTAIVSKNNIEQDNPEISWSSSDITIATVTDGTVRGVSGGEAVITATYLFREAEYTTNCTVKVTEPISYGESSIIDGEEGVMAEIKAAHLLSYNGTVDVSESTKEDELITMHIIPHTVGDVDFYDTYIYLTDKETPTNSVMIKMFFNKNESTTYVQAGLCQFGLSATLNAWGANQGIADETTGHFFYDSTAHGTYGTPLGHYQNNGLSLTPDQVTISYDSTEKALYLYHNGVRQLLLDIDRDYGTKDWAGFASGSVNIKMHMAQVLHDGIIFIDSVGGVAVTTNDVNISAW